MRCLFTASDTRAWVGQTFHFNGSCVETDKDGDNVFTTFDDKNHYLIGGTGKYKGIMGELEFCYWHFSNIPAAPTIVRYWG